MHHKRRRPKNRRGGCLMCKPHKMNGARKTIKIRGIRGHRSLKDFNHDEQTNS